MSVFLRWPDKLPLPLLKSHSIKPGNPVLETKMDSGYSRVRRKHKSVPDTMPVKHLFRGDEAALFNGFYEHGLNSGVNQFVMPVLLPEGLIDHVVRFKPPIKSLKSQSKTLWMLDAIVMIERRFIVGVDEYEVLDGYGIDDIEMAANEAEEMNL